MELASGGGIGAVVVGSRGWELVSGRRETGSSAWYEELVLLPGLRTLDSVSDGCRSMSRNSVFKESKHCCKAIIHRSKINLKN